MMTHQVYQKNKFFTRGWLMILLAFLLAVVTQGFGIYHFSMVRVSLVDALGVSSGEVGVAYSCYALALAFAGLSVGWVLDKIGLRGSLLISAVVYSAGFVMISFVNSLPMLFLCYILLGAGNSFAGVLIVSGIPGNWFVRYRGIANGIIWASTFAGSLFVTNFIAFVVELSDWRAAMMWLGAIAFAIIVFVSLFLKWRPQEVGLLPDGVSEEEARKDAERAGSAKVVGLTLKEALKTRTFWFMAIAFTCTGVGEMGPFQSIATWTVSLGHPLALAAAFMSLIGFVSLFSKIGGGILIDKIGAKASFAIIELCAAIGLIMLMFVDGSTSMFYVYSGIVLFGIGESAAIVCFTASAGKFMGVKHYAKIFGALFVFRAIGDAIGSPVFGFIADSGLGFSGAFGISALFVVLSAVLFFFAKKEGKLVELEKAAAEEMSEEFDVSR